MKRSRLIHVLKIWFLLLYRWGIWGGLVWLLITSPLWQELIWHWELGKRQVPADESHIIYDTAATAHNYQSSVVLQPATKAFPFTIQRSEIENETRYSAYDITNKLIWTVPESEARQESDSLRHMIWSAEQFAALRQQAQIDSVLRYNPDAYIIQTRGPYRVWEPSFSSGFTLRMASGMGPIPNRVNDYMNWMKNTETWQYIFTNAPQIEVRREPEFGTKDYYLIFFYKTWRQFKAIPIGAMILGKLPFLLAWIAWLIGAYQLKRLFEDLYDARYFDRYQSNRIRWVGWTLLGYFGAHFLLMNAQNLYVRNYFAQHDFWVYTGFIPIFPDNWSLLVIGLVLLVLAHMFEHGRQLEEENELTI